MIIGSWKAVKDVPVRMENKSFILPSGAIIAVIDMDGESKKILAEVGPKWKKIAMEPSQEVLNYVKYKLIKYAKSRSANV